MTLEIGRWKSERGGENLDVGGGDGRLAVKKGGDSHFVTVEEGGQVGESQVGSAFGFEENRCRKRDVGQESRLFKLFNELWEGSGRARLTSSVMRPWIRAADRKK